MIKCSIKPYKSKKNVLVAERESSSILKDEKIGSFLISPIINDSFTSSAAEDKAFAKANKKFKKAWKEYRSSNTTNVDNIGGFRILDYNTESVRVCRVSDIADVLMHKEYQNPRYGTIVMYAKRYFIMNVARLDSNGGYVVKQPTIIQFPYGTPLSEYRKAFAQDANKKISDLWVAPMDPDFIAFIDEQNIPILKEVNVKEGWYHEN